ncbi:hypothetical protein AB6A40_006489 [Gnathostoma spinigerum]|uniref:Uncharacterized protein n=1 Tax=Gnathostoma spinigerum TaxID=75299 RepID=A0ABD6EJP6_9BILA
MDISFFSRKTRHQMDLLSIKNGASRPSLVSSLWSLNVQMQSDVADAGLRTTLSQVSLPIINKLSVHTKIRTTKSFPDMRSAMRTESNTFSRESIIKISSMLDLSPPKQKNFENIYDWLRTVSSVSPSVSSEF